MSETTKPYDPWEATEGDSNAFFLAYYALPDDDVTGRNAGAIALHAVLDRVRDRVEAHQAAAGAAVKPEPHHDKPWVKIGNWILQPDKIARVNIAEAIDGPGGGFGELKHDEIQALLAYLTNPVRCVDLTPAVATTTANP